MRIESITLQNYRQFRKTEIFFNKKDNIDLNIVIGKNGTGKTNLLNAINWCLYGDEPHLSRQSELLPILNLNSLQKSGDGEDKEVIVEVRFDTGNNKYISFEKRATYRIYKNEKQPVHQITDFEARIINERGNTDIINKENAVAFVERIVPKAIRDFFFFDGERLDNYFREATVQNIRHSIFIISQIELLETKIEHRLEEILKELRRDAGKINPKIEDTRKILEDEKTKYKTNEEKIVVLNNEIFQAKAKIEELNQKLIGIPDLESLENERLKLKASKKHNKGIRDSKVKEKEDSLFDLGKIIMLWHVVENSMNIIEVKKKRKEIPPTTDPSLLEGILTSKVCSICGVTLNDESEKRVKSLLNEVKLSSEIAYQLSNMENTLRFLKESVMQFNDKMRTITLEINNYEKELEKIETRIDQINKDLAGYKAENIKNWVEQRKNFEEQLGKKQQQLGQLNEKKKDLDEKIGKLEVEFNEEMKKEEKASELTNQINFCRESLEIVKHTKESIMNEMRKKIESETNNLFFNFIWKKKTFKSINISDDYDITLVHYMGYPCLGSISAAERELLALSFTLALHKISGFDSPILIDTPIARVSDEHRKNMGEVFYQLSNNKQVILLFTPAEYSPDISRSLDKNSSSKYRFNLSSDEKEILLEEI
jgi:DNA sulfur modification protein DndD